MNAFGVPWWAVAHEAKDPERKRKERTIFGAGAFAWAAEITVALSFEDRTPQRKIITLQTGKVNMAPPSGRHGYALDFETDRGLVSFSRLSSGATGDLGKTPQQKARDRLIEHLEKHGRQTYDQVIGALGITERQVRKIIKDDSTFGRSTSRPMYIYLTERVVTGTLESSGYSSGSSSASPLDPSHSDATGTVGTPPKGGGSVTGVPVSGTAKDSGTTRDDPNQEVPVNDETCWVCGKHNEPGRFTAAGNMICVECDTSEND